MLFTHAKSSDLYFVSSIDFAIKKYVATLKWRDKICRVLTQWLLYIFQRYDQVSDVAATPGRQRVCTFRIYYAFEPLFPFLSAHILPFRHNPQIHINFTCNESVTLIHNIVDLASRKVQNFTRSMRINPSIMQK